MSDNDPLENCPDIDAQLQAILKDGQREISYLEIIDTLHRATKTFTGIYIKLKTREIEEKRLEMLFNIIDDRRSKTLAHACGHFLMNAIEKHLSFEENANYIKRRDQEKYYYTNMNAMQKQRIIIGKPPKDDDRSFYHLAHEMVNKILDHKGLTTSQKNPTEKQALLIKDFEVNTKLNEVLAGDKLVNLDLINNVPTTIKIAPGVTVIQGRFKF